MRDFAWTPARAYRSRSVLIYCAYAYIGFMAAIFAAVMASLPIKGDWGFAVALLGLLVALSVVLEGWRRIKRWRTRGALALEFPGFDGESIPAFQLLALETADGFQQFDNSNATHALGVADERLFVVRGGRKDKVEDVITGRLVMRQDMPCPVTIPRDGQVALDVVDRSDDDIADSAVDRRDYGERLGNMIAGRLTGTSIKTKIIPYAAYVVVGFDGPRGRETLLFGVLTETSDAVLDALRQAAFTEVQDAGWLAETVQEKIAEGVAGEADSLTRDLVGDLPVDTFETGQGWLAEARELLDPDAATIGSVSGEKGRAAARLLAGRLAALTRRAA